MKQPRTLPSRRVSRRQFLVLGSCATLGTAASVYSAETHAPVIDIHQHTNFHGRTDEDLVRHQRAMGVTYTMLLPAGRPVDRPSTHQGKSNGLAAQCGVNETAVVVAKAHPREFFFGCNEVPDLPQARAELEKYLKQGARVIGEQKFNIECDSKYMDLLAGLAREYNVPILMHFQHNAYNLGIDRFHKTLEKYPDVSFIGHAQTWWGNIDKAHDQMVMYPTGPVTPGGITDRLLADYPNMYGDHSAGSGLNALLRDEDHTRGFLERHQNKLMYGSDCKDVIGRGPGCSGSRCLATLRRLVPNQKAERKILFENARRVFRLEV